MKKTYDRIRARQLVPLLEAILVELKDRTSSIAELERESERLAETGSSEFFNTQAALAEHRRQVRLAKKEIETLGCVFDESVPTRILIPGADGNFERGFRWEAGDETVYRVQTTEPSI